MHDSVSVPFAAESTTAMDSAALQACRDRLAATGVDLAAYNSTENAADIADLRVALGIDTWNVYGVSYGSRLASTVLRDHPQGIRSVIPRLGVARHEQHRRELVVGSGQLVQGDLRCVCCPAGAPQPTRTCAEFTATVNRLDTTPAIAQVKDASGSTVTVNVDGFALAYTVIMTSERGDASGVPKMIAEIARGDPSEVAAAYLALRGLSEFIGLGGSGLAATVFCAESANLTTEAAALAKAKAALPGFPDRVLRVQPKQGRLFTECRPGTSERRLRR